MFAHWFGLETGLTLLSEFLLCALVILFAGSRLCRAADTLAEKTGLARGWVGLMFLAIATSLPELISCAGAVTVVSPPQPNLAFGNVFGANVLNFMVIVVLDTINGREPLIPTLSHRQIFAIAFGCLLMVINAAGVLLGQALPQGVAQWGWLVSLSVFLVYLLSVKMTYDLEHREHSETPLPEGLQYADLTTGQAWIRYLAAAGVIVLAGLWLVQTADRIAAYEFTWGMTRISLGRTFVGTLLLPFVTTLPELVVSITAFRLVGADMALGNLLGSVIFNMAIIPIIDLLRHGPIYAGIDPAQVITALLAIALAMVLLASMSFRSRRGLWILGYDSLAMLALYVAGMYCIFKATVQQITSP